MVSKKKFWFGTLVVFLVVAAIFIFKTQNKPVADNSLPSSQPFNVDVELSNLKANNSNVFLALRNDMPEIVKRGDIEGVIGLTDLAFEKGMIPLDQCHIILHLIGHIAYQKYPNDLTRLAHHDSNKCVASFQHGIEAQIVESNLDKVVVVSQLISYCTELRKVLPGITCYHGAGHGSMRTSLDAKNSLALCDALAGGPEKDLSDCYRGVFSEYGNQVLNFDGDSGEQLAGEPKMTLDFKNPLITCNAFEKKYQDSCASQLTKIIFKSNDTKKSFEGCMNPRYQIQAQLTCVRIVGALFAEHDLFSELSPTVPAQVYSMNTAFKRAYLAGVRLPFLTYRTSNITKEWKPVCNSFPKQDDKKFCQEIFSDFQQ